VSGHIPDLAASPSRQSRVPLVVGLGSPLRGDDGVGLEFVRSLQSRRGLECKFLEASQPELDLFELLEGQGQMLFLDAVVSGAAPGTIHLIPLPSSDIQPKNIALISSHGFGLTEAIELRLALGRPVPRLMLLGFEIETVDPGVAQSEKVQQSLRAAMAAFPTLLQLIRKPESSIWRGPHRFCAANFYPALCSEMGLENEPSTRIA
jgi:hydrogenase maturation protease